MENVFQLEDANSYPIAPFTLASGVTLSNYNKNLQEQVDFMNIDVINGEKEEVENDINNTTNETVESIHTVMGNGKDNIMSISAECMDLDSVLFPLRINTNITFSNRTEPYKENISCSIIEYDEWTQKETLLTSVTVKKKINKGIEKIIYEPKKPKINFSFTNEIEGGHEEFSFSAATWKKTANTTENRYLVFYGADQNADIKNVNINTFSKTITTGTSYTVTLRTPDNTYVWILVPNDIKINKIQTSDGADFTLSSTVKTISVSNLGVYKAYRSNKPQLDSSWVLQVS